MMVRLPRRCRHSRSRRSVCLHLDALEGRWTPSQGLPADGTIIVTTEPVRSHSSPAGLVEVNPTTGKQSILSSGGYFVAPYDVREAPNSTLYVVDYSAQISGAVIALDPETRPSASSPRAVISMARRPSSMRTARSLWPIREAFGTPSPTW